MLVTPQLTYPTSAPVALGGSTSAAQVGATRGIIAAQVSKGSAVYALLRWNTGLNRWETVRLNGATVTVEPTIRVALGEASTEFSAIPTSYYTALLTTSQPDGSASNLVGIAIQDAGISVVTPAVVTLSPDVIGLSNNNTVVALQHNPVDSELLDLGDTGKALIWGGTEWTAAAIPGGATPSDDPPQEVGTTEPGVSAEYSRGDHVHELPEVMDPGTIQYPASIEVDSKGRVISATNGVFNVQTFTTPGAFTWNKPAGARLVKVVVISGGGGGGSGRRGTANSSGGTGGGGGGYASELFEASILPGAVNGSVGDKGTGGSPITVNDTNGNPGTDGGNSNFGDYLLAFGGRGGTGGSTAAVGGGVSGSGQFIASQGGAGQTVAGGNAGQVSNLFGAGGGGGGGGYNGGANAGGTGAGPAATFLTGRNAAGGTAPAGNGANALGTGVYLPGNGGGGGASSADGATAAGSGGAPSNYGGGGGGGGGSLNGGNSGAGADGALGVVVVYSW